MFKQAEKSKFFSQRFYKRYFFLDIHKKQLEIWKFPNQDASEKKTLIKKSSLREVDQVKYYDGRIAKEKTSCEWKFKFTLVTKERDFNLFCRTEEEQFLWLSALYRICNISVADPAYRCP